MTKMTVIYQTPSNPALFDQHYWNVHIPLAKQLPGLIKYEVSQGPLISTTGHNDVYLIGNLYFESMDTLKQAFASEIGQQCAADRKILAPTSNDVQIYLYETQVV
ncbi:EthD family reductase [Mucilaginibacter flavus]|uniref:EthD family reductase n=1 Tax=Mucilaginibacter flavus TaxID=931504 RepID=UPI0025B59CB2|nr:EthD family reductase [Mucilaginibacter flavus]MDN3582916.1 EthD family reductase [Mucilaginibacter flavus]